MSNETTVHVRRPGNPKKWRAKVLCEGKIADLALVTVEDDQFWTDELLDLQFVDVPELQASAAKHCNICSFTQIAFTVVKVKYAWLRNQCCSPIALRSAG